MPFQKGNALGAAKTYAGRYRWTDQEKKEVLEELRSDPTISPTIPPSTVNYEAHRVTVTTPSTFGVMGAFSTGWASLDRLTLGFNPGDYSILGAGTNQGKTQVALYIAIHQARQGIPTLYISRELSADELTRRVEHITGEALPALHMPDTHRLAAEELGPLVQAWRDANAADSWAFVVVDHIHAFCRGGNLTERIGELSESLRELAQDLQIPILALSQLNRHPYKPDEGPGNSHLKESGYLEDDAYTILMGWRTSQGLHLRLTKSRNVDLGDIEQPVVTLQAHGGRLADAGQRLQEHLI